MLLEVLVAAVVAVVLITLLTRLGVDNGRRVAEIRGTSGAMAVARSVMEESSDRRTLEAGERRGMAGAYRWVVVTESLGEVVATSPRAQADQETTGTDRTAKEAPWTLYRIGVAVEAPNGRTTTLEAHCLGRTRGRG
jgi:hypothetical protein